MIASSAMADRRSDPSDEGASVSLPSTEIA
jgi:hypothetical protein